MHEREYEYFRVRDLAGKEVGHLHWGDHVSTEEGVVKPRNYIEVARFVFDAEEVVRKLLECERYEPRTASMMHHRCCSPVLEGTPEADQVEDALQWNPEGIPYILRIANVPFTRRDFTAFLTWATRLPTWNPAAPRGMNLTRYERMRWLRLAELVT